MRDFIHDGQLHWMEGSFVPCSPMLGSAMLAAATLPSGRDPSDPFLLPCPICSEARAVRMAEIVGRRASALVR